MIDSLRRFFESNTILVFLVYGQVFFTLGLAIALQSWRHTRLTLARSLRWLAAFGIIHGIHEWGAIIIPIQANYVSESIILLMLIFQVISLVVSFLFLFQFGVDLLRDRAQWLIYLPTAMLFLWSILFFIPNLWDGIWSITWHRTASIWARYLLGLPGGILAAVGLRYQAERQIKTLNLDSIYRTMQVAGLALGAYAILSGFIVPPGNFFPANWLNSEVILNMIGIPAPVLRSIAGFVIAVTVIRALEVFNVEIDWQMEEMQIEHSLMAERERIGRELHDGAIQQVYTAGLLIESMRGKSDQPELLQQRTERAIAATNEAIASLRAYMVGLRPHPESISLVDALREQAANPQINALLNVKLILDLPDSIAMTPVQTTRILTILREGLSNAARHSQAHQVIVHAQKAQNQFILSIKDDGLGFASDSNGHGFGLRDMRDQARILGGELQINSHTGDGVHLRLSIPMEIH